MCGRVLRGDGDPWSQGVLRAEPGHPGWAITHPLARGSRGTRFPRSTRRPLWGAGQFVIGQDMADGLHPAPHLLRTPKLPLFRGAPERQSRSICRGPKSPQTHPTAPQFTPQTPRHTASSVPPLTGAPTSPGSPFVPREPSIPCGGQRRQSWEGSQKVLGVHEDLGWGPWTLPRSVAWGGQK